MQAMHQQATLDADILSIIASWGAPDRVANPTARKGTLVLLKEQSNELGRPWVPPLKRSMILGGQNPKSLIASAHQNSELSLPVSQLEAFMEGMLHNLSRQTQDHSCIFPKL